MPINGCYTLVELLNLNCMEEEMPCAPGNPPAPNCPTQTPFTECCSGDIGLGHNLYSCRYPTGCGDATYPAGLSMNINSWPNTGNAVFAYRAFDCTDGISEAGMMAHANGIRTGLWSSLRYTPGVRVSGLYTHLVDGASNVIAGTTFMSSVYDPSEGQHFAMQALGTSRFLGDIRLDGNIVDNSGNVLVSGSGAGSGGSGDGSGDSAAYVTDVAIAANTLTFTYSDGTTENITLPSTSSDIGTSPIGSGEAVFAKGPVDLGGPFSNYATAYYFEQSLNMDMDASLVEFLSPGDYSRVSIIAHNELSGTTTSIYANTHFVNNAWAFTGGISNGNYYSRTLTGSSFLSGMRGGKVYAGYFEGDVHIAGAATCTAGGWSDYVFSPDYELPDFGDYMEETLVRGAFPNMPTEEEAAQSLNLAEFAKQILEKVEMIYLYHGQLIEKLEQKGVI